MAITAHQRGEDLDLLAIGPLPSYIWYQDMADFAEGISDERAARRLARAIQGEGAFRLRGAPAPAREDALVVQLDDRSGELARITRRFKEANINLRSVRVIRRWGGKCFVALAAERSDEAKALVKDVLVS